MVVKGSLTLLAVDDSVNMLPTLVLCVLRRLRQAERDPPFADSQFALQALVGLLRQSQLSTWQQSLHCACYYLLFPVAPLMQAPVIETPNSIY